MMRRMSRCVWKRFNRQDFESEKSIKKTMRNNTTEVPGEIEIVMKRTVQFIFTNFIMRISRLSI